MPAWTQVDHDKKKMQEGFDPRPLYFVFSVVIAVIFLLHDVAHSFVDLNYFKSITMIHSKE